VQSIGSISDVVKKETSGDQKPLSKNGAGSNAISSEIFLRRRKQK
jgi:hypothetical protein